MHWATRTHWAAASIVDLAACCLLLRCGKASGREGTAALHREFRPGTPARPGAGARRQQRRLMALPVRDPFGEALEASLSRFVARRRRQHGKVKLKDDPTDLGQRARVFTAPGLGAQPFWPVPAAIRDRAIAARRDLRRELLTLLAAHPSHAQRHGRNVDEPLRIDGRLVRDPNHGWRSLDFLQDGAWDDKRCAACPCTMAFLRSLPSLCECSLARAYVSILTAGKTITPHHGRSNVKLRMQLPLSMGSAADGFCEITVGGVTRRYDGEPILFDDS